MQQLPIGLAVDHAIVQALPNMLAAINLCISAAGRQPKEAYIDLGIDKGHWSKIQGGQNSFPADRLNELCDLMGNDIPLQWRAFQRGKGVHLLESEQQRIIREKDAENEQLKRENALMRDLIQGRGR